MNKNRFWLIVATSLIIVGLVIFSCVMTAYKWDFTKLSTKKYQTNEYEITEDFSIIEINSATADISILPSQDGKSKVVCFDDENLKYQVGVNGEKLSINLNDQRKWYEYIGIDFYTSKLTIYLNQNDYFKLSINQSTGDVEISENLRFNNIDIRLSTGNVKCLASSSELIKIQTTTGDITLQNLSAGALDLRVSTGSVNLSSITANGDIKLNTNTGDVKLENATCKSLITDGDSGDITLKNVIASDKFIIERDTGDVSFNGCDASEIQVETDTGDVTGSLLSSKIFMVETDTGRKSIPQSSSGGKCKIETDTGDIIITIV